MGCWNKTCGLSNLHIYAGDEVYVFVLEEGKDSTDRCYSTAFFSPLLLPFNSHYDDYGGGENSSGVALPFIMEGLRENLIEMEQGENQYHDIPVKRDEFDVDKFFEAVHEGRLFTKGWRGEKRRVEFVMFRKDIVDDILANWEREKYVGDNKGNRTDRWGERNYFYYKFEDILADVPAFLDRLTEKLTVGEDDADDGLENIPDDKKDALKAIRRRLSLYEGLASVFEWRDTNKVGWYMFRDTYRYSSIVRVHELIMDAVTEGRRDVAEALLIEHLKAVFLDSFLHSVRKVWIPGAHEGSQSNETSGYQALIGAMSNALEAEKTRWGEDEEEDDDEEE